MVERPPAYAPDLNPVEALWSNLKGQELANLGCDTLGEAIQATCKGSSASVKRGGYHIRSCDALACRCHDETVPHLRPDGCPVTSDKP